MSSTLLKMISDVGMTPEDFKRASAEGRGAFAKDSVENTAELRRILTLPRRSWEEQALAIGPDGRTYVDVLSEHFRAPGGTQKLRPVQAAALIEMHDYGGLLGLLGCGFGKTILSMLGFIVLEAQRPLLLVPAKLIEKTRREMHAMRKHWLIPPHITIRSYELLGREQSAKMLEELNPDVIICDEAHKLRVTQAAVTRRVKRWMEAHPETRFVAMSGTITKRSLHDYTHLAAWAIKRTNPTPTDFNDRMAWAAVLDEKTRQDVERVRPGALIEFCNDEERALYSSEPQRAVRKGYQRRLRDTPGVIATTDSKVGASLQIDSVTIEMPETRSAVRGLKQDWTRPDGEPVFDAIEVWRHLREIGTGFYYRWNPTPPQEWLLARRAWAKAVREILRNNRIGLDSEGQIKKYVLEEHRALTAGEISRAKYGEEYEVLAVWLAMEKSFTPNVEAVWLSQKVIDYCVRWMKSEQGIVWVEHIEFGRRLAQVSGVPYYQKGGVSASGKIIEDHLPGTSLIASIASNAEGRNLQAWSKNLITSHPSSGALTEQLYSRTHRDGQEADEVSITLAITLTEQAAAFERARSDAQYIQDTTGQHQRVCYADISVVSSSDAPTGM